MFQVNASFNRAVLEDVIQELYDEGIQGVTITEVLGRGCTGDADGHLREKVMITVLVPNETTKDKAMEAIRANAQGTEHGSGKMWVTPVLEIERIRTGERNTSALAHSETGLELHPIDVDAFNTVDTPAS
jgi:nitrogen regulatory protein PII